MNLQSRIIQVLRGGAWHTTTAIRQALWDTGLVEPTFAETFAALEALCTAGEISVRKKGNGWRWRIE